MQAVVILLPESDSAVGVLFNATSTLYEFFQKLDSIAWGVAAIVENQAPRGTLKMMYPAFGLAVVFVTVLQVRQIIRLIRHQPRRGWSGRLLSRLSPRNRILADWAVAVLTVTSGISLLVVMPILLGAPWTILVLTDLGLWVGIAAILQLIIGALRLWDIWSSRVPDVTGTAVVSRAN